MELRAPLTSVTTYDKKSFNKICLVDADYLKYHVVNDIQKYWDAYGDPELKYGKDYLDYFTIKKLDETLFDKFSAKGFIFCFSGSSKDTYRYACAVEKEYKGTRKGLADTGYLNQYQDMAGVITCVSKRHSVLLYRFLEADDLLSVLQNNWTMIFSHDKDMLQIPGDHYDVRSNSLKLIDHILAERNLAYQMIVGDTSDNICGIPRIGEKGAKEFLDEIDAIPGPKNYFIKVVQLYIQKFGTVEGLDRFTESWNLLKLRTNRGPWFLSKIQKAIEARDLLIMLNFKQ